MSIEEDFQNLPLRYRELYLRFRREHDLCREAMMPHLEYRIDLDFEWSPGRATNARPETDQRLMPTYLSHPMVIKGEHWSCQTTLFLKPQESNYIDVLMSWERIF